jgi:hypothetical protein
MIGLTYADVRDEPAARVLQMFVDLGFTWALVPKRRHGTRATK